MKIGEILIPKPLSAIREDVPNRYRYAMIDTQLYDLKSGIIFQQFSNTENGFSAEDLLNKITDAFRHCNEILTWNEVYYGGFHFRDYIVLNELFSLSQKWDTCICGSAFNGETELFELHIVNTTLKESYRLSTKDMSFRDRILSQVKDLELVKLHLAFESLGGKHEIPSRFIDLVQRAGWEAGIKMITAILSVLEMMQAVGKIGRDNITTRLSDRLTSDDHDIIYRFFPGSEGYQLITRHLFEENTTSVRIFKDGIDEYAEEVFEW